MDFGSSDSADGRARRVYLTKQGSALIWEIRAGIEVAERDALAGIDGADLETTIKTLRIVKKRSLASLKARGLSGVHLVISDAHAGLKAAVAQQFTNSSWQRCRVHFMRNLHTAVSAKHAPAVTAASY